MWTTRFPSRYLPLSFLFEWRRLVAPGYSPYVTDLRGSIPQKGREGYNVRDAGAELALLYPPIARILPSTTGYRIVGGFARVERFRTIFPDLA